MTPRRYLPFAAVVGLFVGACGAAPDERQGCFEHPLSRPLRLHEFMSTSVDAPGRPILISGDTSTLAVVSEGEDSIRVFSRGHRRSVKIPKGSNPIGLWLAPDGNSVEMFSVAGNAIVHFDTRSSAFTPSILPPIPLEMKRAVRSGESWYVGGHTRSGAFEVFQYRNGRVKPLLRIDRAESILAPVANIIPTADGVLVNELRAPFRVYTLDTDGRSSEFRIKTGDARPDAPAWVVVSVLPLRGGYIASFADPASDNRRLLLLDKEGEVVRERAVKAPISFVSLTADLGSIIGVRHAVTPEVVFYQCGGKDAA